MKKIALLAIGAMIVAGTFAATPVAVKQAPQTHQGVPPHPHKHKKHHHKKKHHATGAKRPA